jgi:hypothetical protein
VSHGRPIDRLQRYLQLPLVVHAFLERRADAGEESRLLHVVQKGADILRAPRDDGDREDDLSLVDLRSERRDPDLIRKR